MVHDSGSGADRSLRVEDSRTSDVDPERTPTERDRRTAGDGREDWVVCNLCGADDYTIVFRANEAQVNQVVRCNQCSLMYANPRTLLPNFEGLKTLDADPYAWLAKNRFRLPKERRQVRDYRKTRAYLRAEFPNRGKLVEAGSGTGSLLKFFRDDGWDVEGIDPWAPACFYAKKEYGITAHAKTFEEAGFPDVSIDVLMMIHVIEHMLDPAATFTEAYRTLKPGGILIMETPRYESLMFKLLQKRERSVSCDGHIYFFTTDTLTRLGEKAGFSIREVMYVGRSLSLDRLAFQIGVMSKSPAVQRLVNYVSIRLKLDRVWGYLNVRDMQRVHFAKPR